MLAREQGRVGLAAKTVLGFTPPCSFPRSAQGLCTDSLELAGGGCVYVGGCKLICSSPHHCTNQRDERYSSSLGKIFPPCREPPFLN